MLQGKVQSALRYPSKNTNGDVLKLDDLVPETTKSDESVLQSTRDVLNPLGKHSDARSLMV